MEGDNKLSHAAGAGEEDTRRFASEAPRQEMMPARCLRRLKVLARERVRATSIDKRIHAWRGGDEQGQSLIEFALVVPVFLLVVTGVLVFGIYEMQVLSLTEGVDSAGRLVSVSAGNTTDPCALAATAVQQASTILRPANLSYTLVLNPLPGFVSTNNHTYANQSSCSSASTTTGAAGYLVTGGSVTVTATYNNCSLAVYGRNFASGGCTITSSITEVVQ